MGENAVGGKVLTNYSVVKLLAVVSLEGDEGELKLCQNVGMKRNQAFGDLRLSVQRESPNIMSTSINENKVIFEARIA
jgi:hypothetical protein